MKVLKRRTQSLFGSFGNGSLNKDIWVFNFLFYRVLQIGLIRRGFIFPCNIYSKYMLIYFHNLVFVLLIIWNEYGVLSKVILEPGFVRPKGFFRLNTFAYFEFYCHTINIP